jgi:hypothetical protein
MKRLKLLANILRHVSDDTVRGLRSLGRPALLLLGLVVGSLAPSAPAATPVLGVNYDGPWDDPSQWNGFDSWFGTPVLYRNSFCAGMNPGDTWAQFDAGPWFINTTIQWLARSPNHREVMALPLLPTSENGNFASVYNGTRTVHFQNWAQKLIDAGIASKVIVRLGWEFNQPKIGQPGNWFPWGCGPDHAGFAKAFHAAVVALRSKIPGLKIIWNPNCGGNENWQGCWPTDNNGVPQDGDVDYIGIDPYDDTSWAQRLNSTPGLSEIRSFAASKGKPECWPEWGLRYNGDNTSYIQNMYNWMTSGTNVFYQAYWNNTCCNTIGIYDTNPIAPNSAALYKTLFGSTTSGNTHGGAWAVRGVMSSSPSWKKLIAFDTSTSGGTSYDARIWVKGSGKIRLLIVNNNWEETLASLNITATSTWTLHSVTFATGSNTTVHYTLYDAVGGTAGTIYMDDAWLGTSTGGANLIGNSGFESGSSSWIVEPGAPFTILQNP